MDGFNDYLEEDLGLDVVEPTEIIGGEELKLEDNIFGEPIIDKEAKETVVDGLLKAKGITNSMVKIVDENEEEKEVNFYDLSIEDQLGILNTQEVNETNDLDDSEIELLNHLRTNNLSVEEFLEQYRNTILAEVNKPAEHVYEIDSYDDHELFLLDLKIKYDLTDEELQLELEKELQNPDLLARKVTKLRAEYKELEDDYNANEQLKLENKRKEDYNQFTNTMVDIATNVTDFHGVFLEDEEKTETLSYLLDLDESGISQFSKDLNNPDRLYEAAWYLRYGSEAFKALESAYEAEIARLKKEDKPRVLVRNSENKINSIYDLD